ncbi:MAG: DNA polymerase III subunit alpha [Treponema sp.]|nr:DNA polymerase III subunit alpha [Treponema sp.]
MTNFVHLHVHSDNSIQDAAVSVAALADRAEELGMEYLALTDHGNMFGAMEFIAACREKVVDDEKHEDRKNPIKPIIGSEVYIAPGSRHEKNKIEGEKEYHHLVLLAANKEGYHNLLKLCSCAYTEGFYHRPRIDDEILKQYHKGLIALSACVSGEIPMFIQMGNIEAAEKKALYYRNLFGKDNEGNPNFFLEIQNHGIPAGSLKRTNLSEKEIYDAVIKIHQNTGIPLVATNDIHYLRQEDAVAHDILLCIGQGKPRTEEKRKKYSGDQYYFKSAEEMTSLFSGYPEALENTVAIATRCTVNFMQQNKKSGLPEYRFPKVDVRNLPKYLPDFEIPKDLKDAHAYLRVLTGEGLRKRYIKEMTEAQESRETDKWDEILNRTNYELDVIIRMGFTGYFLIVADIINWAKNQGIDVGPGRGSGAGSIVAYALQITDIEPLKYGLLFERFLNPERISMPDFDVDFCNERRDEVISYVSEKYGKEKVAQIITFGTLGAKAVIKDVARALSISIAESEAISALVPFGQKVTLARAFIEEPKLRGMEEDSRYTELFQLARKLEGLKRHCSIHAAGIVIGKDELTSYVPLYRDSKTGIIATQYSMNYLEGCGLIKMDILGLKTLDLIHHTEELIRRKDPAYADFSVKNVPEDDTKAFAMLSEGRSFGIFQFESDGMQNTLKQAKPGRVEDLIALNALYRPGPKQNIPQFIESKNGKRKISYPHPNLEDVLKETYGVIIYQEQVMEVVRVIAGFSLGNADVLRWAMGKKKMEVMAKKRVEFMEGAAKRDYSKEKAEEIFELLKPFAGYGFNKSHAAGYAILAYRTAYLKAHFPAEFMAANLSNEINSADKDKLSECISEGRKMGITIDPPDINRSEKFFNVVDGKIVFGFLGIKGIGSGPADQIIEKRNDGSYKSFMDFLDRVPLQTNQQNQHIVSRKVIELLIQTGAFDSFGINRPTLKTNMEAAIDYAQNKKDEGKFGQVGLFEDTGEETFPDFEFTQMPEMDRTEQLNIEKELIGFYFSGHPLDAYQETMKEHVKFDISGLNNAPPGNYTLIGILKSLKPITDKTGKPMAFATLEDYSGELDLAFFGEVWEACRDKLQQNDIVAIKGRMDQSRGRTSLQVAGALTSAELREGKIAEFTASGNDQYQLKNREVLDKYRKVWEQNMTLNLSALQKYSKETAETNHVLTGILSSLRTHVSRNNKEMAFGTLEDYQGRIDVVFFERCWEQNKDKLIEKTCVALRGKLDLSRGKPSFLVSSLLDLGKMRRSTEKTKAGGTESPEAVPPAMVQPNTGEVHIRLHLSAAKNEKNLYPLRDYLIDHPGSALVFIHVPLENGNNDAAEKIIDEKIIRTGVHFAANSEQITKLGENPLVAEVWVA